MRKASFIEERENSENWPVPKDIRVSPCSSGSKIR